RYAGRLRLGACIRAVARRCGGQGRSGAISVERMRRDVADSAAPAKTGNPGGFVHLHNHTEYSMLDGAAKTADLFAEAERLGMSAVGMTDHGNMFGASDFYNQAVKAGIKPIIGIEAYVAPESRFNTKRVKWGDPSQKSDDVSGSGAYTHMTMVA